MRFQHLSLLGVSQPGDMPPTNLILSAMPTPGPNGDYEMINSGNDEMSQRESFRINLLPTQLDNERYDKTAISEEEFGVSIISASPKEIVVEDENGDSPAGDDTSLMSFGTNTNSFLQVVVLPEMSKASSMLLPADVSK